MNINGRLKKLVGVVYGARNDFSESRQKPVAAKQTLKLVLQGDLTWRVCRLDFQPRRVSYSSVADEFKINK